MRHPDLLLLDIHMPGLDGFEVCRRLKAASDTADIPVIFLSAEQDVETKVNCFKLGAMDYITKPFQPEEVLSRVAVHLELRHLQQNLNAMCEQRTRELQQEVIERRRAEAELYESRQQLRELTGHLQEVREVERARIAREIHDELGQALSVARIHLTRLRDRLDEPRTDMERQVNSIIDVLEQASDTARSISENLRPGMLDLLGLGPAIKHHVQHFSEATGIRCLLHMNEQQECQIEDRVAIAAFRILQEALTNVARHAQARTVDIHVFKQDQEMVLTIVDDGQGLQAKPKGTRGSYGLLGMKERAELLGGSLRITSHPGQGVNVEARLPCGVGETA
jgi:signal transduction histidine kinase